MGQAVIEARGLPDGPLDAASEFHDLWLADAREAISTGDDLAILFDPASHPHRSWRLASVQELAREAAPQRVNGIEGEDGEHLSATLDYLVRSPGITGQLLTLGAGIVA